MGTSLLKGIVKLLPRKRGSHEMPAAKAVLVNAETPRPKMKKENQNMKEGTQIVHTVGGVALLGRLGSE